MCGLVALITAKGNLKPEYLAAMCQTIAHRGPDGEGFVLFNHTDTFVMQRGNLHDVEGAVVGFGHRRLSIVDVSNNGHQPMSDPEGRYWITYNGEIYNFEEIRRELMGKGYQFRTLSDTEVILAAWKEWGRLCLEKFNGMFAFVLYDRKENRVHAVRDRFGVKPLYIWHGPNGLLAFASEIKAFSVLPDWTANLDTQQAYDFLVWGLSDHTRHTFFAKVEQVEPGHLVEFSPGEEPQFLRWYQVKPSSFVPQDFSQASEQFADLFMKSVKLRLRADVPVGTALSGGLDSSSIVCAVHRLREQGADVSRHAFSARSAYKDFDEGSYMQAVVERTGVDHHETWPDADGFLQDVEKLVWHHDEPFSSASIYAEWKVFEAVAKTDVKVTLDGHGADETLLGYTAFIGPHLAHLIRKGKISEFKQEWVAQRAMHGRSSGWMGAMVADELLPSCARSLLRKLTGRTHPKPEWIDLSHLEAQTVDPSLKLEGKGNGVQAASLAQLSASSLPMQLKWADRDSMAHSIESREPFLDHQLVEFILGAETSHKLHLGVSKRMLREGLSDLLPEKISQRRDKMGFVTPEELWVTKDRPVDFSNRIEQAIEFSHGLLTKDALNLVQAVCQGKMPFHTRLIRMLTFGLWMKRFGV